MVQQLSITVPSWLYESIEERRGATSRSEYITEQIIRGMRLVKP